MSGSAERAARFRAERSPWERPALNPAFVAWRASGRLAPCRILLPGAGRGGEPLALARDGFDVTVVDPVPRAVAVQRVRMQSFGLAAEIHQADPMGWSPAAPFDVVYDHVCLAALPPAQREGYAARLLAWLRPGGALFVLLPQTGAAGGPPFDCPPDAMRKLFAAGWSWPDNLPANVPHSLAKGEIPVVIHRD